MRDALQKRGLDPFKLEVEITESTAIADAGATGRVIEALKNLGVRVTLDDFGTGYSSSLLLAEYPFDTLKIDRSFVARIVDGVKERALTAGIIGVAKRASSSPWCASSAPTRSKVSSSRGRCP